MNDGHATKALPETFCDNCPQRLFHIQAAINHRNPWMPFTIDMAVDRLGHSYERYISDKHLFYHSAIIWCLNEMYRIA